MQLELREQTREETSKGFEEALEKEKEKRVEHGAQVVTLKEVDLYPMSCLAFVLSCLVLSCLVLSCFVLPLSFFRSVLQCLTSCPSWPFDILYLWGSKGHRYERQRNGLSEERKPIIQ
jgi:hypothetical protein